MMGWYSGGMGWGGWVVMTLAMVVFWALVVFAVVAFFRTTSRDSRRGDRPASRDPRDILDARFARGEIDVEEYHTRLGALRGSGR